MTRETSKGRKKNQKKPNFGIVERKGAGPGISEPEIFLDVEELKMH